MQADLGDLNAFVAVARAGGFRDAARLGGVSASGLSEAVRRLEQRLGVRLLNRSTRTVVPTEAGRGLIERLGPALHEVELALDVVNGFRDRPTGTLRLNVPMAAARLVLPALVPSFLDAYPDIVLDVVVEDTFVDMLAAGCDAGIRYEERLEQDMIAVPIGPRVQRFAAAAAPAYLARRGSPEHPRDLTAHACLGGHFAGTTPFDWSFERDGETVNVIPRGPLQVRLGGGADLAVQAAIAGTGIVYLSRTGCARTSPAAHWCPCWSRGGRAFPARSCTTRGAGWYRRRYARSSTSSAHKALDFSCIDNLSCTDSISFSTSATIEETP